MWSLQLTGEHDMGRRALDWAISGAGVTRDQPDKSELIYNIVAASGSTPERRLWEQSDAEGAVRTFSRLDERSVEGRISHRWNLGRGDRQWFVKVGSLARGTKRDANTQAFGLFAPVLSDTVRELPPEELFGGRFTAPDSAVIDVRSLAQGGSYTAEDGLAAGFAMAEVPLTPALSLLTGARLEYANTHINAISTLGDRSPTTREFTDVLPALVLTYRRSDAQAIRLSGSRTLARPEYRELAAVRSRDVHGGIDLSGNPALVRTLIDNADLRWEFYPRGGELLSVALFAKRFHYPIERVSRSSSNADFVTFVNAHGANNYGIELEARKDLDVIAEVFAPLTAFSSVTWMRSKIDLGDQANASTNADRAMVGQAPYVINAGLTYSRGSGSATVLFNRVGDRISEAGVVPMPDVKELARNQLDFSLRVPASQGVVARLDAKNLLGTSHLLRQGSIVRELYRIPRTLQLGVNVQR
jgi:TonB-dependent receptor